MHYDKVIQEIAPHCIASRGTREVYDWLLIGQDQLREIENRLRSERISRDDIDFAVLSVLSDLQSQHCNYLCMFAFKPLQRQEKEPLQACFVNLLRECRFDIEIVQKVLDKFMKVLPKLEKIQNASEFSEARDRILDEEYPGEEICASGRLAAFVVSSVTEWNTFYAICREHFGDAFEKDLSAQHDKWDWLVADSQYIMAVPINLMSGRSAVSAENLVRHTTAMAECLRHRHELSDSKDMHGESHHVKALTVPVGEFNKESAIERLGVPQEASWEFELNSAPFRDQADLIDLDAAGLRAALDGLDRGRGEFSLWKAVEHFEGALNLGGVHGVLDEDLEMLWKVAALWTALEVRAVVKSSDKPKRVQVEEYVLRVLRTAKFPSEQIDQARDWTRKLYDRRNDGVHAGTAEIETSQMVKFRNLVATVLGVELSSLAKPPLHPAVE